MATKGEKTIGILGGLGPDATNQLCAQITALTPSTKDQEHLKVITFNNPKIPDRTAAILGKGKSPVREMRKTARILENAGVDFILIPCNTAHHFIDEVQAAVDVPIINMIDETVKHVRRSFPSVTKVGLLATTGTVGTKIYEKAFKKQGIRTIIPSAKDQSELVMESIYGKKGVKAGYRDYPRLLLEHAAGHLQDEGAELIIMGCTEISLALDTPGIPKVDPSKVLAKAAVQQALNSKVSNFEQLFLDVFVEPYFFFKRKTLEPFYYFGEKTSRFYEDYVATESYAPRLKKRVLMTVPEDESNQDDLERMHLLYQVGQSDCVEYAQGLADLGHEVYFVNWRDLDFSTGEFTRMYDAINEMFVEPLAIDKFDMAFIYKMEGFIRDSEQFSAMCTIFQEKIGLVVNDPRTIEKNISKEYMFDLVERGLNVIPTFFITDEIRRQLDQGQKFIIKPKIGERGLHLFKAEKPEDLDRIKGQEHLFLAQYFMPSIAKGERSLVFLGKEYTHAVIKIPKDEKEFLCNRSRGARVIRYKPTEKEIEFCRQVLEAWEDMGYPVHYSRVDIIDNNGEPMLVESELLNPSIFANFTDQGAEFGKKFGMYFDRILQQAGQLESPKTSSSSENILNDKVY